MKVAGNIIAQYYPRMLGEYDIFWCFMVGCGGFVATWLLFHVFPLDVSLGRHTLKLIWGSSTWSRGVDYLDMKVAGNIIAQ